MTSTTLDAAANAPTPTDLPTPRAETPIEPQAQAQQNQPNQNGTQNQTRTHQASGYRWTREEDAPSYLWRSAKAQEEMERALGQIADREKIVGRRYGDIGLSK